MNCSIVSIIEKKGTMLVTYHSLSGLASPSQTETKSFSICVQTRSNLRTDDSKYGYYDTVRCTFTVYGVNDQDNDTSNRSSSKDKEEAG